MSKEMPTDSGNVRGGNDNIPDNTLELEITQK